MGKPVPIYSQKFSQVNGYPFSALAADKSRADPEFVKGHKFLVAAFRARKIKQS